VKPQTTEINCKEDDSYAANTPKDVQPISPTPQYRYFTAVGKNFPLQQIRCIQEVAMVTLHW